MCRFLIQLVNGLALVIARQTDERLYCIKKLLLLFVVVMANLIRSAKSGSDWTLSDLDSYNIELHRENHLAFFGVQALPPPQVDPELMNTTEADDMVQDRNAELINLLDLAMTQCAVDDFVVELFKALGYVRRHRVARTRKDLSLLVCGERRHAQTDVCIIDRHQNDIILLVQEDKRVEGGENLDARAQLVAEAIAAFTENNMNRELADLPPLAEKVCNFSYPSCFSFRI